VRGQAAEATAAEVESLFRAAGVVATVRLSGAAELERRLRRVASQTVHPEDAIVVGGGDGTISLAAQHLAGTGIPLGILPLGTLNHFAKDLGLPQTLAEAVQAICNGRRHRVDLAEVNGRVFINNSSVGVYPHMVLDRDRRRHRDGVSKWRGMAEAALRVLRRLPARRLRVTVPGNDRRHFRSPMLFVGNNDYTVSGTDLGGRARLDTGTLCLFVVARTSRWTLVRMAWRAMRGRLAEDQDLVAWRGLTALHVDSRASRLPVSVDGEVVTLRPPLQYRARAGALTVLAP
jgi:diacylglycerol kinase family enzyme